MARNQAAHYKKFSGLSYAEDEIAGCITGCIILPALIVALFYLAIFFFKYIFPLFIMLMIIFLVVAIFYAIGKTMIDILRGKRTPSHPPGNHRNGPEIIEIIEEEFRIIDEDEDS